MDTTSPLYHQIFNQLSQYSQASDRRHLKAIAWMCTALLLSQSLTLSTWEPLRPTSGKTGPKLRTSVATFFREPDYFG